MTAMRTKIYLGGFVAAPALALLILLTLFSFNMWMFLTLVLLFSFGVVFGPFFMQEEDE